MVCKALAIKLVMSTNNTWRILGVILFIVVFAMKEDLWAQEVVLPMGYNPVLTQSPAEPTPISKKKRAALPFVDDFSYQGPYPDPNLWIDRQAYVNNVMSSNQITRGMATLDGLNQYGRPYFPNQFSAGLADSLTSVSIDLSSYTINSNIFLSFYYQPQGLGFAPETDDSLFLYFKNSSNQWIRMWQTWGTPVTPFRVQMVAVDQAQFLHNGFQFRFVNLASLNINNDTWNIDYVKLDANRNATDSVMNDVAFTIQPTSILSPYSAMPYRHFVANQAAEKSALQAFQIRNTSNTPEVITTTHAANELFSGTPIAGSTLPALSIAAKTSQNQSVNSYLISYTAPNVQSPVTIHNRYYFNAIGPSDRKENDTITNDAVFDNYFAYDDGSAEKAYFLYSALNTPAKTALEFRLNEPDTVRGVSAFFAAQAPTALGKYFSVVLYKQLAGSGFNDSVIHQEDLYQVKYDTLINGFTYYGFNTPVVLQPGTYYIGITQPANFGSDSIYYGLDVNNNTSSQHLYYNVDGPWYSSSVIGSVMIRPMVGRYFTSTRVEEINKPLISITLYPNPVTETLFIAHNQPIETYSLYSIGGVRLRGGNYNHQGIPVADLATGTYILEGITADGIRYSKSFLKK